MQTKSLLKEEGKNPRSSSTFSSQVPGIMLYFEIKIVIGLCSIAAVIGLDLGMEYEQGQPTGSNSFL